MAVWAIAAIGAVGVVGCQCGLDTTAIDRWRCNDPDECDPGLLCIDHYCQVPRCEDGCAPGQTCVAGQCVCDDESLVACDGGCVRTSVDPSHCGGCGRACSGETMCQRGECVAQCDEGLTPCDGSCVDLQQDSQFCGECTISCEEGKVCIAGQCQTCSSAQDCDDGLDCTEDACDAGACSHLLAADRCWIDGVCRAEGEHNEADACLVCRSGIETRAWTTDVDDGVDCTEDSCVDGQPQHRLRDDRCADGEVCAACMAGSGCLVPPERLGVACGVDHGTPGGSRASCSVELDFDAPEACLTCTATAGITVLSHESFDRCPSSDDWTVSGDLLCRLEAGPLPETNDDHAVELDDGAGRLEATVNTTDFDHVRLCFDYADHGANASSVLTISIDTGAGLNEVASSTGGPAGVDNLWSWTCFDLPGAGGLEQLHVVIDLATSDNKDIYLDNLFLEGWLEADLEEVAPQIWSAVPCDQVDWDAAEGQFECVDADPGVVGFTEFRGLYALETAWTIARAADASSLCEDVDVTFDWVNGKGDGGETISLDAADGGDFVPQWATEGKGIPQFEYTTTRRSLSHADPPIRLQPNLGLRFSLASNNADRWMGLGTVQLGGLACHDASDRLAVAPPVRIGPGSYGFTASSETQGTYDVTCRFSGLPEPSGTDRITFVSP